MLDSTNWAPRVTWTALAAGAGGCGGIPIDQALLSIARSAYAIRRPSAEREMVWAVSYTHLTLPTKA